MLSTAKPLENPIALAPIDWTNEMAGQWPGAVIVTATGAVIEWVELLPRKCIRLSVIGVWQLPPRSRSAGPLQVGFCCGKALVYFILWYMLEPVSCGDFCLVSKM
jgi:hypothetical protein